MATSDIVTKNKQIAREFGDSLWTERYDDLRDLCTDDAVFHDPAFDPEGADLDGLIERFERMHASMSDVDYEMVDLVGEGEYVFSRGRVEATHTGEFMGIAPTENRVSAADHLEFRFEDGKIAETWAQYDQMGLLRQIGAKFPGGH
jgi:predicted ester cyclase